MKKNLDTIFALEFGQLLENYLFGCVDRERQMDVICSCLGLRNRNQLAQIYAGYDTPTTASIFELIRNLNDKEFTDRFLNLQTTLMGVPNNGNNAKRQTVNHIPKVDSEPQIPRPKPCRDRKDPEPVLLDRLPNADTAPTNNSTDSEWGDEDFDPDFLEL